MRRGRGSLSAVLFPCPSGGDDCAGGCDATQPFERQGSLLSWQSLLRQTRYEDAISCWRRSVDLDGEFSIPWRNLGIAEFNVLHDPDAAGRMYARAFAANPQDARVLYEWDQLKKSAGLASPEERLHLAGGASGTGCAERRPDCRVHHAAESVRAMAKARLELLERAALQSLGGRRRAGVCAICSCSSGAGQIGACGGKPAEALAHFEAARHYPENLGEGKHLLTLERDLDYLSGLAARAARRRSSWRSAIWNAAAAPLAGVGSSLVFSGAGVAGAGRRRGGTRSFVGPRGVCCQADGSEAEDRLLRHFAAQLAALRRRSRQTKSS